MLAFWTNPCNALCTFRLFCAIFQWTFSLSQMSKASLLALCHGEKRYIKWTNRSFSFKTVQRCYGRTSKQRLHVRLYTLTPYVQATFERTSTQPCPYEQRFFYRWKRVFFALQLPFLRVSGIAYLQARSSLLDFIEISELSWMSKWKQKWRNEKHPLGLLTGLNGSALKIVGKWQITEIKLLENGKK